MKHINQQAQYIFKMAASAALMLLLSACAGSGHYLAKVSDQDLAGVHADMEVNSKYVFKTTLRSGAANRTLVAKVTDRLLNHARPICDHTGYKSCFFQILYHRGDIINASASGPYKVTIYKGLLDYLQSEDEIAAVIAHEMGHHLANHNQEKLQNARVGAAMAGIVTAVIIGAANQSNAYYDPYQQQTVKDMSNAGAALGAISYSVAEEREADLLGAYMLARSGYDLKKAERVLWLLMNMAAAEGNTEDRSVFGSSHPGGPERIAAWRNTLAEIRNNPSKLPYQAK